MIPISEKVHTYEAEEDGAFWTKGGLVRAAALPNDVCSYADLLRKVATLAYYNRQFTLLFRGQSRDYMLDASGGAGYHSHLYPSILRTVPKIGESDVDMKHVLERRFAILAEAEKRLKDSAAVGQVSLDQVLRWALLQHYEVCLTPLLDVTSSLQIAVSFAVEKAPKDAILYVLAVPHLAGPISVSLDAGTQVFRLAQVCPPEALRPHFQEAALVGNYPPLETEDFLRRPQGKLRLNIAGRLLAKFRLIRGSSWTKWGFRSTAPTLLRPDGLDLYFGVMSKVRDHIRPQLEQLHALIRGVRPNPALQRAKLDRVRSAAQPLLNVRGDVIGQLPDDLPQKATLARLLSELRVILQ